MHAGVLDATSLALPSSDAFLADGPASFFDAGLVPQANGHSPFARVECSPDFLPNHRNGDYLEGQRVRSFESALPSGLYASMALPEKAPRYPVLTHSQPPGEEHFRPVLNPLPPVATTQDRRRAALMSVDSALSAVYHPLAGPAPDSSRGMTFGPFQLESLDFLNQEEDEAGDLPETARSVRLKLATAPADIRLSSWPEEPQLPCPANSTVANHSGGPAAAATSTPELRTSSGGPGLASAARSHSAGGTASEPGVGLAEAKKQDSIQSSGSEQWARAEVNKLYGSSTNPRKTEQNRRAQARFRQKKKDMFMEQQRQINELSAKLERAMHEKQTYQEKSTFLQKMVEVKEQAIEALRSQGLANKDDLAMEELIDSIWAFVTELKRGRASMMHTRDDITAMVNGMLQWASQDLAFMRKELVEQLAECLKHGGEDADTPANLWLSDLINAHERMVHRCGECHPQAFRTYLALPLQEQNGRSADRNHWMAVLEAGRLRLQQKQQLADAHTNLVAKMSHLLSRRQDIARLVQSAGGEPSNQQPLLGNIVQSQHALELHARNLKDEQAAIFNFLTVVRLVLEPVQQARLMVASYPFALDTLAICALLAEEAHGVHVTHHSRMALGLLQAPASLAFNALKAEGGAVYF